VTFGFLTSSHLNFSLVSSIADNESLGSKGRGSTGLFSTLISLTATSTPSLVGAFLKVPLTQITASSLASFEALTASSGVSPCFTTSCI
jgi:hypothetical protein